MKGKDVARRIAERQKEQFFIKWWRKEEDWLDFDLIDRYLQNVNPDEEIGGFSLVGMEEMWEHVQKLAAARVSRETQNGQEVLRWQKKSGRQLVCQYTPESLMQIFDVESHGNFVDT